MEPNANQPEGVVNQPQPAVQPVVPPVQQQAQPITPPVPPTPQNPKKGMGKKLILIVILLLLVVGMAAYALFAKNQLSNTQKTTTDNTIVVTPTPTPVPPTLAPEEDLEISSPEADLLDLDADVKAL